MTDLLSRPGTAKEAGSEPLLDGTCKKDNKVLVKY